MEAFLFISCVRVLLTFCQRARSWKRAAFLLLHSISLASNIYHLFKRLVDVHRSVLTLASNLSSGTWSSCVKLHFFSCLFFVSVFCLSECLSDHKNGSHKTTIKGKFLWTLETAGNRTDGGRVDEIVLSLFFTQKREITNDWTFWKGAKFIIQSVEPIEHEAKSKYTEIERFSSKKTSAFERKKSFRPKFIKSVCKTSAGQTQTSRLGYVRPSKKLHLLCYANIISRLWLTNDKIYKLMLFSRKSSNFEAETQTLEKKIQIWFTIINKFWFVTILWIQTFW